MNEETNPGSRSRADGDAPVPSPVVVIPGWWSRVWGWFARAKYPPAARLGITLDYKNDRLLVRVALENGGELGYALGLGDAREHSGHLIKACATIVQGRRRSVAAD